jgi:hypothetical protein
LIVGPSEEAREVGQVKKEIAERYHERNRWWVSLIDRSIAVNKLHAHINPGSRGYISTSSGIRGLNLAYVVLENECAVELYIDRGKDSEDENLRLFDELHANRDAIEKAFGAPLSWERLDGKRTCRIKFASNAGGYRSPEEQWPTIQDTIIQAMDRLEKALRPYLKQLKVQ